MSTSAPLPQWLWSLQQWEVVRLIKDFTAWMAWRMQVNNARARGLPKGWGVWIWGLLVRCEKVMGAEDCSGMRELGKCALKMLRQMRELGPDAIADADAATATAAAEQRAKTDEERKEPVVSLQEDLKEGEEINVPAAKPRDELEEGEERNELVAKPEGLEEGNERNEPFTETKDELEEGEEPEEGEEEEPKKASYAVAEGGELLFYSLEDTMGMLDMVVSIVGDFYGQRDLLEERAALMG